jgi:hypothetical protein
MVLMRFSKRIIKYLIRFVWRRFVPKKFKVRIANHFYTQVPPNIQVVEVPIEVTKVVEIPRIPNMNIPWTEMTQITRLELPVRDILLAQYFSGDFSNYKHADGAVRQLALEEYLGLNNYGFDLFNRMHVVTGQPDNIWVPRYKQLISSYIKNGFDNSSPISLGKDLVLLDGSHRLTLANYYGQEFIAVNILNGLRNRVWDNNFFWMHGFSRDECIAIYKKSNGMLKALNYSFLGVIWPPAFTFADEIIEDMRSIDPEVTIDNICDYEVDYNDFEHIIKALYYPDIMTPEGAEAKNLHIRDSITGGRMRFRTFELFLENPRIAVNEKNYMPQSQAAVRFKKIIRQRYSYKVYKYQYDVILHLTDNYYQSKFCKLLFAIDRDLSQLFTMLSDIKYTTLSIKEARQSHNFPKYFFSHSDIDILVCESDKVILCERISAFVKQKYDDDWQNIRIEEKDTDVKIYINIRDYWIFLFDVSTRIDDITYEFAQICLDKTIQEEYKYLPEEYEMPIRIARYVRKPHKYWHLNWINNHTHLLKNILGGGG